LITWRSTPWLNTSAVVPHRRLDGHPHGAEDGGEQHERQPDDEHAERQQGGGEPLADVDLDGGEAGHVGVDAELLAPLVGVVVEGGDEVGGGRVVGPGRRHDLDQGGVRVLVRGGERHGRDAGDGLDVLLDARDHAERVGAADDVTRDDQRPVDARAEVLGGEVVRDSRGGPGGLLPRVGQRDLEPHRRQGERAERGDDRDDGHDRVPRRHPDPPRESSLFGRRTFRRALRRRRSFGAAHGLDPRRHPRAQQAHEGGQQRQRDDHREGDGDRGEDAHHGQERDVGDAQPEQRDEHRQAGEHDRRPRRPHGAAGGLLGVEAVAELVAVTRQDEQRVVDADGEAEHDRQQRRRRVDVEHAGEQHHQRHGDADARDGGDQRQAGGDQRAEHDGEHHQRDDQADALDDAEVRQLDVVGLAAHTDLAAVGHGRGEGVGDVGDGLQVLLRRREAEVEAHLDDGGPAVVGDHAVDEVVPGGRDGLGLGEGVELVDGVLDLGAELVDVMPLGRDDDRLRRQRRSLRERHLEAVEGLLRRRGRDREGVLERPGPCRGGAAEHGQEREPDGDHREAAAVAPPAERVERG
jgi:hypothetical protein